MKKEYIEISPSESENLARNVMVKMAQRASSPEAAQNILNLADAVYKEHIKSASVKVKIAIEKGDAFNGYSINMGGETLECDYFGKIPAETVNEIVVYGISVELQKVGEEDGVAQVYTDLWESAFLEGALIKLNDYLEENFEGVLSPAFGPGYFSMPMSFVENFYNIVEGQDIGISINEEGALTPAKSLLGMYMVMSDYELTVESPCSSCQGGPGGCSSCTMCTQQQ